MNPIGSAIQAPPVVPGYQLERVVGQGATSTVWAAVRQASGERVAVKITRPERYHVGQLLELAARETAILARVDHEHIVRLHEAHPLADGSVAVVLDLAEGGTLTELLAARGRLDEGEVSTLCTPLGGALAALHAAGVIHGDLAPGNILLTADGRPLLADFEAARLVGESHPPVVAGTRGFVAPEMLAGDVPTEASDVYGLGALAWFALTGRALSADPMTPPTAPIPAPSLAEARAMVGPHFAPIVAAMLADDPAARPAADQAAVACYQAASPSPIRLPDRSSTVTSAGAPPAALAAGAPAAPEAVTQLLRHPGWQGSATTTAPTTPLGAGPAPSGAAAGRGPGAAPAGGRAPAIEPAAAAARTTSRATLPTWARVAIVLGALILFAALMIGLLARQRPASGSSAPTPTSASTSARPSVASTGSSVTRDDPVLVLSTLATARAAALVSADPAALAAADAPGSAQLATDSAMIESLRRADQRYAELSFTVRSAEWVGGDDSSARILAVVDRSSYRVVGPGTATSAVAAEPGRPFTYTLTRVEGGWRIVDVVP